MMKSQDISDIPFGDSSNSDLGVASFTEVPKKRPHKRIVKTDVALFLPAEFIKDDRLVAAVKITSITTVNLLSIVCMF